MSYTEDDLEEFRKFLYREPPFAFLGGSITTYPNGDENQQKIYVCCAELKRRGLAQRGPSGVHQGIAWVIFREVHESA